MPLAIYELNRSRFLAAGAAGQDGTSWIHIHQTDTITVSINKQFSCSPTAPAGHFDNKDDRDHHDFINSNALI